MSLHFSGLSVGLAIGWIVLLSAVGAALTKLDAWYYQLRQPSWKPPDWLFAPAWTTIFLCAAFAFALAWNAPGADRDRRMQLTSVYILNGILNAVWSALFFRAQRPDWSLVEVPALWLTILAMMQVVGSVSPRGALLLLPYLLWVAFAAVLNRAVVRLNRPFAFP